MKKRRVIPPEIEQQIFELWQLGFGKGKIALKLKFSETLIERFLKESNLHRTKEELKAAREKNPEMFKDYFKKFQE